MLRPDPGQRPRLEVIRDNLTDRIAEADREGWLGEIEGLHVSLADAKNKLTQLEAERTRNDTAVHLGLPSFPEIASVTTDTRRPPP